MKTTGWQKIFFMLCSLVMIIGLPDPMASAQTAQAPAKTTILLDGYPLPFPVEPKNVNGYNLVPFRAIAEAIGITVDWDGKTNTITATKETQTGLKTVVLQLNHNTATVNGQAVPLPVSPMEINGSTLVPLSFFSTQFGAQVSWDANTRTVSIVSPPGHLYSMAFYAISSFAERSLLGHFDAAGFGWSRIDANGNLTLEGKDFYWPQAAGDVTPQSIIDDSAAQGTAPYLLVFAGDGTGELTKLLEDATLRDKAIKGIGQLVAEKRFAGVVLDFEGLGMSGDTALVKQQYNEFVRQLAAQLQPNGTKLSLVLHPLNGAYQGYDYTTLGTLADDLIIMAYAYENEKQPEPLGKVDQAIKLATAQVPKSKLLLGISMGSENAGSVNSKIGLAKRYGLKGIAIWRLGLIGQPAFAEMQKSVQFKDAVPVSQ